MRARRCSHARQPVRAVRRRPAGGPRCRLALTASAGAGATGDIAGAGRSAIVVDPGDRPAIADVGRALASMGHCGRGCLPRAWRPTASGRGRAASMRCRSRPTGRRAKAARFASGTNPHRLGIGRLERTSLRKKGQMSDQPLVSVVPVPQRGSVYGLPRRSEWVGQIRAATVLLTARRDYRRIALPLDEAIPCLRSSAGGWAIRAIPPICR